MREFAQISLLAEHLLPDRDRCAVLRTSGFGKFTLRIEPEVCQPAERRGLGVDVRLVYPRGVGEAVLEPARVELDSLAYLVRLRTRMGSSPSARCARTWAVRRTDTVTAVGIDGLMYGRQANVL